jgi:hypothetical protein
MVSLVVSTFAAWLVTSTDSLVRKHFLAESLRFHRHVIGTDGQGKNLVVPSIVCCCRLNDLGARVRHGHIRSQDWRAARIGYIPDDAPGRVLRLNGGSCKANYKKDKNQNCKFS